MQGYEEPEAAAPGTTEPDPEQIRQLYEENRRLRKQIRHLKAAAAERKKVEFSKLIFLGVSIVTIAITVFSCRVIWLTMDTSALAYLIPAVFAEMASATGFYYSKAKAENKIKLMAASGVQPEPSNFNDY
ncbi:MAG: hypothetical protein HFF25_09190 [Oscillospiraceae bacterium]|jgi:hypothetical protein|nr:hypothetical protein [Oscillospiraceae bacterium]